MTKISGCAFVRAMGAFALSAALASCGFGDSQNEGTVNSDTQRVTVSGEGGASVSYLPTGAKSSAVTVRVARDSTGAPPLPQTYAPAGAVYQFTPLGAAYAGIEVRVAFDPALVPQGSQPSLLVALPSEGWIEVSGARIEGSTLIAQVPQFAYATAAIGARGAASTSDKRSRIQSASSTSTSPRLTLTVDPTTAPPLSAPTADGYVAVTQTTLLGLQISYVLPSNCSGTPKIRAYGVFVPKTQGNPTIKTVELANRSVSGTSGSFLVSQSLNAAESGVWTFATAAYCTNPGAKLPNYALLATGPVLVVNVAASTTAPSITQPPQNVDTLEGNVATFSTVATGSGLAYQWQRSNDGGASYSTTGSNSATVSITTATADNGSLWRVTVSNAGGTTTSTPARLTVTQRAIAPTITTDPIDQSVLDGETASFTVSGTATPAASIQWQSRATANVDPQAGWLDIAGATSATFTTIPTSTSQSGSQYRAVLSNAAGSASSLPATLTVRARIIAPSIVTAPVSQSVAAGQAGLFSVVVTGTAPLSYQWFKNDVAITGANATEALVFADPTDAGSSYQITVRASNGAGSVTSLPVTLSITSTGTTVSAVAGGTVSGPNGTSLTIPPGALGTDTPVAISTEVLDPTTTIPANVIAVGDVVNLQPASLVLSSPAELLLPAPADIPSGMTLAVIRLEETSTVNSLGAPRSALSNGTNLRRVAAQGRSTVLPMASAMGTRFPDRIDCGNPQNISSSNMFGRFVQAGGRYLMALVPMEACASIAPRVAAVDTPSTTDQKCTNDADFIPMQESSLRENQQMALLSRHVDCRTGQSEVFEPYADLKETNGSYSYVDPVRDRDASFGSYNIGRVQFRSYMSTFGPSNQLSKRVSLTIQAVGFTPDPSYPGPNRRPSIKIRPIFYCGPSTEIGNAIPTCTASGQPLDVPLDGTKVTREFTVSFNWPTDATRQRDYLTFQLFFDRFEYAIENTPFERAGNRDPSYFAAGLDSYGIVVRCDRNVERGSGCIFPQAAAVFTQPRTGGSVDENSAHIEEAQARGAPGRFRMRTGFRAIADDAVRGGGVELRRTQVPRMTSANRAASCEREYSVIRLLPRASSSCPNGRTDGLCQCDEYPFASTYEGAWSVLPNLPAQEVPPTTSAKFILATHNSKAGGQLGEFYRRERVIDTSTLTGVVGTNEDPTVEFNRDYGGDPFWVKITP